MTQNNQNNTAKNQTQKSLRQKIADEGCLNSAFTYNGWFVKIKPAYDIDKVVFCFVMKGSSGQQSFNVYVDLDLFSLWMEDVRTFRLKTVIANEKTAGEKFPKAYKAVTGEDGAFSAGICASTKNPDLFVINGSGKHKEKGVPVGNTLHASVPVDYNWLRTTAKYFERTSSDRFHVISDTILKESAVYHNPNEGIISGDFYADTDSHTPTPDASSKHEPASPNTPVPESKNTAPAKNTATENSAFKQNAPSKNTQTKATGSTATTTASKAASAHSVVYTGKKESQLTIDSQSELCFDGENYRLQAIQCETKKTINILIEKQVAKKLGETFVQMRKACNESFHNGNHTHFTMKCKAGTYDGIEVLFLTGIVV